MKTKMAILIIIILDFEGCVKSKTYDGSLILAKKEPCRTCYVNLKNNSFKYKLNN